MKYDSRALPSPLPCCDDYLIHLGIKCVIKSDNA